MITYPSEHDSRGRGCEDPVPDGKERMMDKRYQVEELVAVGPDDGEWEPQDSFDSSIDAELDGKNRIKPTEHGESGVRVVDTVTGKVHWTNCYL